MSAPSGGASSAPQCACSNISIMQLFHELKQQFPGVPDHVVSSTISSHCHDRTACQSRLECEAKNYISHLYPSSSLSANKKEGKDILLPQQCPNQLLITREFDKPKLIQVSSVSPQKGVCSFTEQLDENDNQNITKDKHEEDEQPPEDVRQEECGTKNPAPATATARPQNSRSGKVDEVDSSPAKVDTKSSSQWDENFNNCNSYNTGNTTYKILKSSKVTSELNKKLNDQNKINVTECVLPEADEKHENPIEATTKLKRPTTLEFSSDPHFSGLPTKLLGESQLPQPESTDETKRQSSNDKLDSSPANKEPSRHAYCDKPLEIHDIKDEHGTHQDTYPLNVSVNLNCRMDVLPHGNRPQQSQFSEPWRGNYGSPGNYTSVNLTVCTPTSSGSLDGRSLAHQQGDPRQRAFEGRVQITVSPASSHPPPHRGPGRHFYSPLPQMMPETPPTSPIDALVRRQKARLARLQRALAAERGRLASMQREVRVLRAPPSAPDTALRPTVQRLRHLCQRLTRQLDHATSTADGEFYDNIYTGQRASLQDRGGGSEEAGGPWQCHVCTFLNHGLLNKCEECDMPRIILGMPSVSAGLLSVLPLVSRPTNLPEEHLLRPGVDAHVHAT